ncbi:MAG: hypothetical protein CL759_09235 [Chloroflexi bacterium]|nr:hypothetical protein [Chloroflexota bacterium]
MVCVLVLDYDFDFPLGAIGREPFNTVFDGIFVEQSRGGALGAGLVLLVIDKGVCFRSVNVMESHLFTEGFLLDHSEWELGS